MTYPYPKSGVINPLVPFATPVEGGVSTGKVVSIHGSVPHGADKFSVNLQSTPSLEDEPRPDTSLHIAARFKENAVVRNSCQYGEWATEERHGGMPFYPGAPFELTIYVEESCYKIFVNGREFTRFTHKMQKEVGSFLRIDGHIHVSNVRFQGTTPYPYPNPNVPTSPMFNPPVPFHYTIGAVMPGRMIFISGKVHYNPDRFSVNLQSGLYPESDLALHFDARFRHADDRNVCVRNSRISGKWGTEERSASYFPFAPNSKFDMIILVENYSFKVAINNRHFVEFSHRVQPLFSVDSLMIDGDVDIDMIRLQ